MHTLSGSRKLVAVEVSEDEHARLQLAIGAAGTTAPRKAKFNRKTFRHRVAALQSTASLCPSGWRNSHIQTVANFPDGMVVLQE